MNQTKLNKLNLDRFKSGLTLREIAIKTGYSESHIRKIFCGVREPSKETLDVINEVMKRATK